MKPTACLAVLLLACISEVAIAATAVDLDARAETLFSAYAKPGSPGVALLVLEDGRPVLDKAWGQASLEHGVPFTRDTVVRLPYSEAREFLATAAVLMEKDGLVDLDAPLRERFPELPAWAAEVDAWDLLNHRSGFVDEWATLLLMHDSMANHFSEAQFLQLLSRQPRPEVPPGEGYLYSNSDMGLLKLLLQRAAGKPLREWMAERMFGPLGMTATQLDDDPAAVIPRKAQSYSLAPGGYQRAAPDKTSPGGNYYIASSARDLACWANALADPGSDAAWANALLRQRVRTIPPKQEQHRIFGQTELEIAGELVVLHQGVNGFTWLARVPKHRLAVVATTNGSGVATQLRALVDAVVGAVEEAKPRPVFKSTPVSMSLALLDRYAGEYEWQAQERWQSERPVRGRRAQITTTADGLRFDVAGQQVQAVPVGDDLFYARFGGTGVQFRFQPLPDDGMALAIESDDGYPTDHLRRNPVAAWRPGTAELDRLVGLYRSDFLDYEWRIARGGPPGTLLLQRPTAADAILEPDGAGTFRLHLQDGYGGFDAWVTFHQEVEGAPSHLTVGFPRLMDHRFDRVEAGGGASTSASPSAGK